METALKKMDSFSRTKKNMHLPIREGIQDARKELGALRYDIEDTVSIMLSRLLRVPDEEFDGTEDEGVKTTQRQGSCGRS